MAAVEEPIHMEELTPPLHHKSNSWDNLTVARVLQAGFDFSNMSQGTNSPTIVAAADHLGLMRNKDHSDIKSDTNAVNCLLALSHFGTYSTSAPPSAVKRKLDASPLTASSRRRLKMRSSEESSSQFEQLQLKEAPKAPIPLQSDASVMQLKLLAAAYKLCPHPSAHQIQAVAQRVGLAPEQLTSWFRSRQMLQEWVQQRPNCGVTDVVNFFSTTQAPLAS